MATLAHYASLALLLCICGTSIVDSINGGFSVDLIHRDSSRSPFYRPTETHYERVANAVTRSNNHANQAYVPTNTVQTTIKSVVGEYLISYSIGTPPLQFFGDFNTGSDYILLKCKPCENCYNKTIPIFDPSKSKTYKTIPCNSSTCQSLSFRSCSSDSGQNCTYTFPKFLEPNVSQGVVSKDTLTLNSTNGSPISFPRTVIGCEHKNTGISMFGQTTSVVGLGNGPMSLISQLGSSAGGKFSYCLLPMLSESKNSSNKLNFGDDAVVSGDETVSTPFFQSSLGLVGYWLTLEAFSVGNHRIEFASSSSGSIEEGNIVIDSSVMLVHLPHDVYTKLESAVANVVKLKRVEDPNHQFSLCYKTTSEQLEVPIITAHFKGANIQLNAINTFLFVSDEVACLAFIDFEDIPVGIFGFLAQQNFLVGYDLKKNIVSFKPTDCTKH
ncbi:aspartic proteinase CDR1-like [Gastrolobium bilobum]|uniref:aspartic proteinase CDR1-like n=1 Tax=Gastrolobium bilobum TaxID=150636 RepID=UPI002AB224C0|nr:aspartic proteinase CDR1-like [Gastrolobium bilobum]